MSLAFRQTVGHLTTIGDMIRVPCKQQCNYSARVLWSSLWIVGIITCTDDLCRIPFHSSVPACTSYSSPRRRNETVATTLPLITFLTQHDRTAFTLQHVHPVRFCGHLFHSRLAPSGTVIATALTFERLQMACSKPVDRRSSVRESSGT